MRLDERILATIAYRLLQFYKLETSCDGTLDEANQWFAARLVSALDTEARGKFLEAFLRGKAVDEQIKDLKWMLGAKDQTKNIPT